MGAFLPRWVTRGEGVDRDSHNSNVSLPTASARMCSVVTRLCRYRTILLIFHSCFFLRKMTVFICFRRCCVFAVRGAFLQLWLAGAALHCGAPASQCSGFPCGGARAPGPGGPRSSVLAALAGSSRTRDRTRVSCMGRRILKH